MTPPAPPHPFSTIISLSILDLIRARDLELQTLRNDYQSKKITKEELTKALELSEAQIADDVLAVCVRTIRSLEETVEKVLQLQEQMRIIREAEASWVPNKV